MKPLLQAEEQTDNQPQEEVEALQEQLKEQATTKPKEEQKNGGNFGSEDKIMPKIRLSRTSKGANKLRAYRVLIDDKYVGVIHRNQTKEFEVDFGEHTIQCTIDWERSNHITVDIQDDLEELEVIAKGVFESSIRAIFPFDGRDKYLTLSKKSK